MSTRESFYALFWDKVPEHLRGSICGLARVGSSYALLMWDEIDDAEVHQRLGVAIFELVEAHDHNRAIARKDREARRPARAA